MTKNLQLGPVHKAIFEVVDTRRATGFGLHVASSPKANGRGAYPEFFLYVTEADEVEFVYLDGSRSSLPMVIGPTVGEPIVADGVGIFTADLGPSSDPSLDPEVVGGSNEPRGLHRFVVNLGKRDGIESIVVSLTSYRLAVDCRRESEHSVGPPRSFNIESAISLVEGDLGSRPELFYSVNGLISAAGHEGAGSGWKAKEPRILRDGDDSDDDSLLGGTHENDDPGNDPTGG